MGIWLSLVSSPNVSERLKFSTRWTSPRCSAVSSRLSRSLPPSSSCSTTSLSKVLHFSLLPSSRPSTQPTPSSPCHRDERHVRQYRRSDLHLEFLAIRWTQLPYRERTQFCDFKYDFALFDRVVVLDVGG